MKFQDVGAENIQRIIELYLCSNDNRMGVIADLIGIQTYVVSDIIQAYFDGKIEFNRGNFKIMHSSINNYN